MKPTGIDILVKPKKEGPYGLGETVSGKVMISTSRELVISGLKVYLFWRERLGKQLYQEELKQVQRVYRSKFKANDQREYDFVLQEKVDRNTFTSQGLELGYFVVARVTLEGGKSASRPIFQDPQVDHDYVEGVAKIDVVLPLPAYRATPQNIFLKGTNLWWLASAGAWLTVSALEALPLVVIALGAVGITSVIYSSQLYYFQETPIRILEGGDNGMRVMFYTSSDARVLEGQIYYQIRVVKEREEKLRNERMPIISVGGRVRDFGHMTDEGFQVTLPWIESALPIANHLGISHYQWELVLHPKSKISFSSMTWPLSVHQLEIPGGE